MLHFQICSRLYWSRQPFRPGQDKPTVCPALLRKYDPHKESGFAETSTFFICYVECPECGFHVEIKNVPPRIEKAKWIVRP